MSHGEAAWLHQHRHATQVTSVCTTQSVLCTHVTFCVGSEVNSTGRVVCGSSVSLAGSTIPAIQMRILPAHTHSLTPSGSDTFHALYVLMQVLSSCRQKSCHLADSFLLICSHDKAASCVSVLDTVCTNWLHSDFKHVSSWQQVMGWYTVMSLFVNHNWPYISTPQNALKVKHFYLATRSSPLPPLSPSPPLL